MRSVSAEARTNERTLMSSMSPQEVVITAGLEAANQSEPAKLRVQSSSSGGRGSGSAASSSGESGSPLLPQRMHVRTAVGECHVAFAMSRWDETRAT